MAEATSTIGSDRDDEDNDSYPSIVDDETTTRKEGEINGAGTEHRNELSQNDVGPEELANDEKEDSHLRYIFYWELGRK